MYWDGANRAVYVYEQTRPFDVILSESVNVAGLIAGISEPNPDHTPEAIIDRTAIEAIEWALETFDDDADSEPEPEVELLRAMLFAGLNW